MSAEKKPEKKAPKQWYEQLFQDLVIGGLTGAVAKTAMSPVERVKIIWQTRNSNPEILSGKVPPFKSPIDVFFRVIKDQGAKALWRGNLVNCLRYAPQQGSALAFNDAINNHLFPKYDSKTDFWKSFACKLGAGGLSGAIANTICYPLDFARTRLATGAGKNKEFNGIGDCIMSTVKKQGITGLYAGYSATVAGAFVYRAGQLGCFKQIQDFNPYKQDQGWKGGVSSFVAVTTARTVVMPFNYPFDTIRRNMMLGADKPMAERLYTGSFDCFKKILKRDGVKGLYAGMVPELARGLGGSLVVVAYDRITLYLSTH